jgi:hypothetical protein
VTVSHPKDIDSFFKDIKKNKNKKKIRLKVDNSVRGSHQTTSKNQSCQNFITGRVDKTQATVFSSAIAWFNKLQCFINIK